MRKIFINTLMELAKDDSFIMALAGDLGFGVFDEYQKLFPQQYINTGVAEQNMTGMATGLASEGYKVLTYSIANFNTLRCLEQIRNDVCYHDLNVNIISVGAGFAYGSAGFTHYAIEDIAILKSLPNLEIYTPATTQEVELLTKNMFENPKPCYMRIGSKVHNLSNSMVELYTPTKIVDGSNILILTMGDILGEALEAVVELEKQNISVAVYNIHTIKPINEEFLIDLMKNFSVIITLEEHITGGLGSIIAEIIAKSRLNLILKTLHVPQTAHTVAAKQDVLREYFGIDKTSIIQTILDIGK